MQIIATFSIVAHDPHNGDLGIAVASKFLAVGAVVPWAQAGAGAVATQSYANVGYGPRGLAMMAAGCPADLALAALLADDPQRDMRQVGIVDSQGRAAAHTGARCSAWAGQIVGEGFAAQGNILTGPEVVEAMASAFRHTSGELAERLTAALVAGDQAGGDQRGRQGAALYVARAGGSYGGTADRYIDLRADDHPHPVAEIARLLQLHRFYLTPPDPATLIPITPAIAAEIRNVLQQAGFYNGSLEGAYDAATHAALLTYGGVENLEERLISDTHIDPLVLEYVRSKRHG